MAPNVVHATEAGSVMADKQAELVIPREGLDADKAVTARVPINRLSGRRVERTELFTLHDLAAEGERTLALAETEVGVGVAGERVVASRRFLKLEVATDKDDVVIYCNAENGVEVTRDPIGLHVRSSVCRETNRGVTSRWAVSAARHLYDVIATRRDRKTSHA